MADIKEISIANNIYDIKVKNDHALKGYEDKGEFLTDKEGLEDVKNYNRSTFDRSKFTVVGTPTITDDGIASGFSVSNYLTKQFLFPIGKKIKVCGCFTMPTSSSNSYECIFSISSMPASDVNRIWLQKTPEGNLQLACYNGEKRCLSETNLLLGETYKYECVYESGSLILKYKHINEIEYKVISSAQTGLIGSDSLMKVFIGIYYNLGNSFSSSINLKYFSIEVDGVEVFNGNKTGIDQIKADNYTVVGSPTISDDGIASGFNASNHINTGIVLSSLYNKPWTIKTRTIYRPSSEEYSYYHFGVTLHSLYNGLQWVAKGSLSINGEGNIHFLAQSIGGNEGSKISVQSTTSGIQDGDIVDLELSFDLTTYTLKYRINGGNLITAGTWTPTTEDKNLLGTQTNDTIWINCRGGGGVFGTSNSSFDLNAFKIYVDGNLVYQPTLRIPYTQSKTGSKIVNAVYRNRVQDMYEQFGWANYYTLSESDFTLPMGEVYGFIQNAQKYEEIGRPIITLSNTLKDNETWLEGAEVSKITYGLLYSIYGDKYNDGTEATGNFRLPNFKNKAIWGSNDFGYIEAGLPQHTHTGGAGGFSTAKVYHNDDWFGGWFCQATTDTGNASNNIYGNSTTVQPPSIKVRVKTKYK